MDPRAMEPYGAALLAYFEGDHRAELVIRREDGQEARLPVAGSFRTAAAFSALERLALEHCRGRVLDVGAGAGLHSLALQERGLEVTAIDIDPRAVRVMAERGVTDARCVDFFAYEGGPFDTLLLLGHGLGMFETLAGLDRFLARAPALTADGGQVLVDSLDVRVTDEPDNLAYHEATRRAGRYVGEIRMQLGFRASYGPICGWLHADAETLTARAAGAGWDCAVLFSAPAGDYLARLTRSAARKRPRGE